MNTSTPLPHPHQLDSEPEYPGPRAPSSAKATSSTRAPTPGRPVHAEHESPELHERSGHHSHRRRRCYGREVTIRYSARW